MANYEEDDDSGGLIEMFGKVAPGWFWVIIILLFIVVLLGGMK